MSRFELVRTDAPQPFHIRIIASNGRKIMTSENYADRRSALCAIAVVAEAFGIAMNRPPTVTASGRLVGDLSVAPVFLELREVDERGTS